MGYFKGWYFKCCTGKQTVSFIPAYHIDRHVKTASLQVITDNKTFNLPFKSLEYNENPLTVKLGGCLFSERGIYLNVNSKNDMLDGALRFEHVSPIKYDIMGPFSLVPFMQCRHSVYSMTHKIDGWVTVCGQKYDFNNGTGYIEGDRGRSFPKEYVWTQCCFDKGSLMLSVADIPMFGFHFTGIIGNILLNRTEYRIATYLGAKVKRIGHNFVSVVQGDYEFSAELLKKNAHPLKAPSNGVMSRTIHESVSCKARYRFLYNNKLLFEFVSDKAGFEFEYSDISEKAFDISGILREI